jgi:hypothetical protein
MAGSKNAKVFPEPVAEIPTMFFPLSAIGHPWDWMGVGLSKPHLMTESIRGGGMILR